MNFDQVYLDHGDLLSGQILTRQTIAIVYSTRITLVNTTSHEHTHYLFNPDSMNPFLKYISKVIKIRDEQVKIKHTILQVFKCETFWDYKLRTMTIMLEILTEKGYEDINFVERVNKGRLTLDISKLLQNVI